MMKALKKLLLLIAVLALSLNIITACEKPSNTNNNSADSSDEFKLNVDELEYESDLSKFTFNVVTDDETQGDYAELSKYSGNAEYVKIPATVTIDSVSYEVKRIGKSAFSYLSADERSQIKYIKIPDTVTSVASQAFDYCSSLLQMDIPVNVTSIGISALRGCDSLRKLSIPFLGNNADAEYKNDASTQNSHLGFIFGANNSNGQGNTVPSGLEDVELTNAKSVQNYGFAYCAQLKKITLCNTIKAVKDHAFFWCEGLTELEIPNSVETMDTSVFNGCSHLVSLKLPFAGDMRDSKINSHIGFLFGADKSFEDNSKYMPGTLRTVTISDDTTIGNGAFYGLRQLTKIIVPNNVAEVASNAFTNCVNLQYNEKNEITYIGSENNDYLIAVKVAENYSNDKVVFEKDCKFVIAGAFALCQNIKSVEFPEGTTSIGERAFYRCFSLESFTLPDNITSIGDSAFYGCVNLKSINISDNSNLTSIGDYAFFGCENLSAIKIPKKVTRLGSNAFKDCSALTDIYIEDINAYLGISFTRSFANPLYHCKRLFVNGVETTNLVLPEGKLTISTFSFSYMKSVKSITIPESVIVIASYAFYGLDDLEELHYAGTMANWEYVNTSPMWITNSNVTKIICSDGEVDLF